MSSNAALRSVDYKGGIDNLFENMLSRLNLSSKVKRT